MNKSDPNVVSKETIEAAEFLSKGAEDSGVMTVFNKDENQNEEIEEEPFNWDAYKNSQTITEARLETLFEQFNLELLERAKSLTAESVSRLNRYKWMRYGVVICLVGGLVTFLYPDAHSIGFDLVFSKLTPLILSVALLFYIFSAFMRDYEVALETGLTAERLRREVRKAKLDWAIADNAAEKKKIVERLTVVDVDISSLFAAEKVGSLSQIRVLLHEATGIDPPRLSKN